MTTITMPSPRKLDLKPLLMLVLLASVILGTHAVMKHSEAAAIQRCLNNNGEYQIWKHNKWDDTFYRLCETDQGWGFQAVRVDGDQAFEKTAFVPDGDGSFSSLLRYLRQFASRFKGSVPWK